MCAVACPFDIAALSLEQALHLAAGLHPCRKCRLITCRRLPSDLDRADQGMLGRCYTGGGGTRRQCIQESHNGVRDGLDLLL